MASGTCRELVGAAEEELDALEPERRYSMAWVPCKTLITIQSMLVVSGDRVKS
jgi:hypothetical protein